MARSASWPLSSLLCTLDLAAGLVIAFSSPLHATSLSPAFLFGPRLFASSSRFSASTSPVSATSTNLDRGSRQDTQQQRRHRRYTSTLEQTMPHVQLDQMPTAETAASSSSTSWMQNRAAARGLPAVSSSPPPSSATSTSSSPALAPTLTLGSLPTPLLGSLEQSKTLPIASTFSTTTSAATAALTRDKLVRIGVAEPCSTPDVKGKNREKGLDEEEEREMKSCVLVSAPPAPLVYNPATGGSNGNGYGKGQLHASSSSSSTAALSDPQLARFGQSRDAATAEMAADPTALRSQAEEEGQSATDLLLKDNNASSSAADSDPFSILTVFSNAAAAATSSSHSHSKTSTTSASSLPQQAAAQVNAGQAPLESTPLVPPTTRKLCIRHQRMADEGTTAKLQKVSCGCCSLISPVRFEFRLDGWQTCFPRRHG